MPEKIDETPEKKTTFGTIVNTVKGFPGNVYNPFKGETITVDKEVFAKGSGKLDGIYENEKQLEAAIFAITPNAENKKGIIPTLYLPISNKQVIEVKNGITINNTYVETTEKINKNDIFKEIIKLKEQAAEISKKPDVSQTGTVVSQTGTVVSQTGTDNEIIDNMGGGKVLRRRPRTSNKRKTAKRGTAKRGGKSRKVRA